MRLTIPQPSLADVVKWTAAALPGNPLYPVMMTLRFEARDGQLLVSAWDGETALHATIDADVQEEGVALLPGKFLNGVVSAVRKSDVTIDAGRGRGVLTAPGVRVDIRPSDAGQWPDMPTAPAVAGTVDGPAFVEAYSRIKAASVQANDRDNNSLSSVGSIRLLASDGALRLATTDRFRVGLEEIAWTPSSELGDALAVMPTRAIEQVRPFAQGQLTLALPVDGAGTAGLSGQGREVVTKLSIPKSFPNVERAVPESFKISAYVDAPELVAAIRTVAMVNTKIFRPVWLRFAGESLTVAASDLDSAEVRIGARLEGGVSEFEIPFRASYLNDGLDQVAGTARISFNGPRQQALVEDVEDGSYRYIVLPIGDVNAASAG